MKIAIAGLGTVGQGVVNLLAENAHKITQRAGKKIEVVAVSARNKNKKRDCDLSAIKWCDDVLQLVSEADTIVELIGGAEGEAKKLAEATLAAGKNLVTANKALFATHGVELAKTAEAGNLHIGIEAAVAGGIPAIRSIREGLAANKFTHVSGILNGTCNYILTEMRVAKKSFAEVLKEAQSKGYAESDPSFDIDGIDTAQKLAILASLCFGVQPDLPSLYIEGIRNITSEDIEYSEELGYRIKLLGIATEKTQAVYPCMIRKSHPLASIDDVYNAVMTDAEPVGRTVMIGRGAGAGATASAVVSDLIDIAWGRKNYPFSVSVSNLKKAKISPIDNFERAFYIRLVVQDKPGVMADIATTFRDEKISIESLIQRGRDTDKPVQVVITTHEAKEAALKSALAKISALKNICEKPHMIRIEG